MSFAEALDPAFDWPAGSQGLGAASGSLAELHASENGFESLVQLQRFQSSELCIESHVDVLALAKDSAGYGHGTPGLEVFINDDIRSLDDGFSINEATGPQSAAPMPSPRFLERQNAELSAELMTAQGASRQLEARLDASRTLCDQLQRALVDAACPQSGPLSPSSLAAIPEGSDATTASDGLNTHSPLSAVGGSDLSYLAHTSTQVLELQVQLAEKDGQLLEMAAQVEAAMGRGHQQHAGRHPRSTSSSPCKAPSLAAWPSPAHSVGRHRPSRPFVDVTNYESSSRMGASPDKQAAAQSLAVELAAERARLAYLRSCLAAVAGDMQQRDATFSRLHAVCKQLYVAASAVAASDSAVMPASQGDKEREHAASTARPGEKDARTGGGEGVMPEALLGLKQTADPEACGLDGNVQLVALAAAGILAELQHTGPFRMLCEETAPAGSDNVPAFQGGLRTLSQQESCPLAPQDQAMSSCAPSSSGPSPVPRSPVTRSLSFVAEAIPGQALPSAARLHAHGSPDAATEDIPADELPPEEQAKHHLREVRRLCHKFDRQVVGLKLEYQLLEASLTERDSAIAELRSQLRRASRTAQAAATSHATNAHDLHGPHHQAEEGGEGGTAYEGAVSAEGRRSFAAAAAAAEDAAVAELQATMVAAQRGRADDARRAAKDVSMLRERATTAEARCIALQRQLEAAVVAGGTHGLRNPSSVGPLAASTRAALAEVERHKKELARVREELSKKSIKLEAVVEELSIVSQSLEAREQIVIALRTELSDARRAAAEATAKLTGSRRRHLAGPWR